MSDGERQADTSFLLPGVVVLAVVCLVALRAAPLADALWRNLAGRGLVHALSVEGDGADNAFLMATVYRVAPEYRPSDDAAADLRQVAALSERTGGRSLAPGVAHLALSESDEALFLLAQPPGDRFSAFWSGIAAEQVGDRERAEATWRDLRAAPLLVARARRQLEAGRLEEAEQSAMLAVEVCAPGGCAAPAEGWAVLGAVRRQAGRLDEAEAAFRAAASLSSLPEYREGLALSALEAGHPETAREVLLGLMADYPHMEAYRQWLARADAMLGIESAP